MHVYYCLDSTHTCKPGLTGISENLTSIELSPASTLCTYMIQRLFTYLGQIERVNKHMCLSFSEASKYGAIR